MKLIFSYHGNYRFNERIIDPDRIKRTIRDGSQSPQENGKVKAVLNFSDEGNLEVIYKLTPKGILVITAYYQDSK